MASNDGYISRDFAKRFEDLDRRKKQSAAIERKKRKEEEAEKAKKGAQAIFKRFTSGDYEDEELHEFTDAELTLMSSTDNADNLTLDENNRVVSLSELFEETSTSTHEVDENALAKAEEARKQAIQDILNASADMQSVNKGDSNQPTNHSDIDLDVDLTPADEVVFEAEELNPAELQQLQEDGRTESPNDDSVDIPVVEDVEIQRIETLRTTEAKVYISVATNEQMNETAYGLCVEQGSGDERIIRINGERRVGVPAKAMVFRAASFALKPYTHGHSNIKKVTMYASRDYAWELYRNSWQVNKKNKDMREADDYSSVFMECADMDVKVNVVFTEVQEKSHQLAKQMAKSLLTVDTLDNFEED